MRVARIAVASGEHYAVARSASDGSAEWAVIEDPFAAEILYTGERAPVLGTPVLAPVVPVVVLGIAHNKTNNDHQLPIQVWHKSPRSLAGAGDEIPLADGIGAVNVEGEMAVVIGRKAWRLTRENAVDAIFGYTIANDVTNIDQVAIDEKFFQVKSGHNYAPIGPWIETEIGDPDDVSITVRINGEVRAESSTRHLPSSIADCLVYVTSWLELGPGDVVLTGAPRTFLPALPGDSVEIEVGGIGVLSNTISREATHV